jgi:hypothetical protein
MDFFLLKTQHAVDFHYLEKERIKSYNWSKIVFENKLRATILDIGHRKLLCNVSS